MGFAMTDFLMFTSRDFSHALFRIDTEYKSRRGYLQKFSNRARTGIVGRLRITGSFRANTVSSIPILYERWPVHIKQ